jgi:hypothetical protein
MKDLHELFVFFLPWIKGLGIVFFIYLTIKVWDKI